MVFTRPLASVTAAVLVALGLLALLPDCASACSCAIVGSQQERAKQALSDSTAVFSGEVVDVEKEAATASHPGTSKITLRVSEAWKGPAQETLEVSTPSQGSACGYPFKEGQEYLVYASGKEEPFKVGLCSETKPLSEAGANLRALGDVERPGEAAPLPDSSGGVPGLGAVGLAGLAAMTAAFLLLKRLLKS
jgi:hypothetical protein